MNIIKQLRKTKGWSQAQLAKYVGVSRSTVSMWEIGQSQPDNDTLIKLSELFGTSVDDIIGVKRNIVHPKGVRIPVIGMSAAGIPIEAVQMYIDDDDPDTWEEITENQARNGTHVAIKIRGDSMEPKISDGDIVIVRLQPTVESGEIAIVIVNGDEATCKKVKIQQDGLILISTNPAYEPMFYSAADVERLPVRIFGKVVEARRKF